MIPSLKEFYTSSSKAFPSCRIAYTEWGNKDSNKIVFCVHGLARNSRDFDYLAAALAKDYLVICPDMPGRGKSPFLEDKSLYNYSHYVHCITSLANYIGTQQIDWVGTSMGGLIGMFTSLFQPSLIHKMVLNDIGAFLPKASLQRIAKYVGVMPEFVNLEQAERHMRMILEPFKITEDEHWRHVTLHSTRTTDHGTLTLAYDPDIGQALFAGIAIDQIQDVDLWDKWQNITCPTLVLRGQISDVLLKETAEKMVKSKSNCQLVELENVGHVPALMSRQQISIVQNWLLQ